MRVRLIDGLNCTPMVFTEKPSGRELTVPVLETIQMLVSLRQRSRWARGPGKWAVDPFEGRWTWAVSCPARVFASSRHRFGSFQFVSRSAKCNSGETYASRLRHRGKSPANRACAGCARGAYGLKSLQGASARIGGNCALQTGVDCQGPRGGSPGLFLFSRGRFP